jgi:hypothetical protein
MPAEEYGQLMTQIEEAALHRENLLASLAARFDQELAKLQAPDADQRINALFDKKGRTEKPAVAGQTF